jgi:hypothetical protein
VSLHYGVVGVAGTSHSIVLAIKSSLHPSSQSYWKDTNTLKGMLVKGTIREPSGKDRPRKKAAHLDSLFAAEQYIKGGAKKGSKRRKDVCVW